MKNYLKLTIILLIMVVFTNCKNDPQLSEYKFSEKEFQLNCENIDLDLIKEAVYSFEADITDYFTPKGKKNLSQAYPRVVNYGINSRANFNKIASPHTQEIFEILRKDTELWNLNDETKSFDLTISALDTGADGYAFETFSNDDSLEESDYGDTIMSVEYVDALAREVGWKVEVVDRDLTEPFQIAVGFVPI